MKQAPPSPDEVEDTELDELLPNAEGLIAQAVALAGENLDDAQLIGRYWRFAPDEELVGYAPEGLLDAVRWHRELAAQRVTGELKLRIGFRGRGWERGKDQHGAPDEHRYAAAERTVIEIVIDDMPFLVDSVAAALEARNLDIYLLVHPIVVVHREPMGRLVEVCADVEPDDALSGDQLESWIRIETAPLRDQADRDELRNEMQRVITDVREAVEDWPRMRNRALAIADELAATRGGKAPAFGEGPVRPPVPDKDIADSVELLRWLADEHFTFLGYREYKLVHEPGPDGAASLQAVLGTGLGILRQDQPLPRVLSTLNPEAYQRVLDKRLLIITKANARATVHRSAYLDYIGFKTFDEFGAVTGERRFLGLFSTAAYRTSVRELPVVRRKVAEVLDRSGLSPRSHSGRDLMEILESYPRDELFQIRTEDLYHTAIGVLRMAGRRQLRVFVRKDAYGRFFSCLIYLPRDRFTTQNRLRMQEILLRELHGIGVDYTTRVTESMLARVHFTVRTDPADPPGQVDADVLAEQLADATKLWEDDFRLVLERTVGDEAAKRLFDRYAEALPEVYKDEYSPFEAAKDLAKLELLEEPGQLEMHLYRRRRDGLRDDSDVRFKVFRYGEPMVLSAVLPVLHSLGLEVTEEHPYQIRRADGTIYLYDFGLRLPSGARDLTEVRPHMENAFSATWRGEAEVDGFNGLVLRAGLTWRQVVLLRAYAKYLRQAGTVFSQEYIQSTLAAYPGIAALLVRLFEVRFDPALEMSEAERARGGEELAAAVAAQLDEVSSLDRDRILRSYLTLVQATLRTSFFQRPHAGGRPKSYVAFKLDPRAVPELPQPRPRYEIFVYSPRFEGVHLRFGAVARGGLRWSDRREDFRTEVLGLVKAQMVKNVVIVPVGAKGGFVLKRPPTTPDALHTEAVACYRRFVSAMLDVTDNIVEGTGGGPEVQGGGRNTVVPPPDVVRHDGDDPYLVVAADKGTATFSDIANEISAKHGYWLGDAFASGGSAGYDHKRMGITARGAWESVKRHFRDLELDVHSAEFTVAGIGDMSGDVFGNAMLLSEHIKLVAAFDHRHIFLDPAPDPAVSYAERRRLFEMSRSSWDDYSRRAISTGGGVYPRSAKSILVTPQVRAVLGLPDGVTAVSPHELIKAILTAPVDLLFNGGIGTYVKAFGESHADVGDKSNDPVRVDGAQLRARVVGEGGNLGLTQRGRIEYALAGGRIYTDFIDNSAGVNTSDREVNIKILLDDMLPDAERNRLLAEMTGEVGALVLRDNYDQACALGIAARQARPMLPVHRRMISGLEKTGRLDRALESLPTEKDLQARADAGTGLVAPEFAVLLAYVKILLEEEVLQSGIADEPWTHDVLAAYFPTPLRERYGDLMAGHRLRREIVTTVLVNEAVNRGGTSFVYRAVEETGASAADVLRAYVVMREVYGLPDLWRAVEALDNQVSTAAQTALYLRTRRLLDRAVRWLVTNRRSPIDVRAEMALLKPGVSRLLGELDSHVRGSEREALRAYAAELTGMGVPADVADWSTRILHGFGLLDVVDVAASGGWDLSEVCDVYFVLSERFRVDDLLSRISHLPREDRWQTLARMALRYDLYAALAALTAGVLQATAADLPAERRVDEWERAKDMQLARVRDAIGEFAKSRADLAALSVLLRQIRTLVASPAGR